MARPAINWVIADTHAYHDAIVKACGRPLDHTERIFRNLRTKLAKQDTLYHLGDVIFYKYDRLKSLLDEVPGRKILVRGNHDVKSNHWYQNNGFHYVADAILLDDLYLTHIPVPQLPSGARLNVHGHWHNTKFPLPPWYSATTHRRLCLEDEGYVPVVLKDWVARTEPVSRQLRLFSELPETA